MKTLKKLTRRYSQCLLVLFLVTLIAVSICTVWMETDSARYALALVEAPSDLISVPDYITVYKKLFYTVPMFLLAVFIAVDFEKLAERLKRYKKRTGE